MKAFIRNRPAAGWKPRNFRRVLPLLLLPACLLSAPVSGLTQETVFPASNRSGALDNTNPFARSAAMGSAFVGVADDASALFANPAGLGFLRVGQLDLNSDFWLADTFQETALLGFPIRGWGAAALAVHYLDYGSFDGRDVAGSRTNSYGANRWGLEGGWGLQVFPDFALGLSLQAAQSNLAGLFSDTRALGAGILWRCSDRLRLGGALNNLGLAYSSGPSEAAVDVGASYSIVLDPEDSLLAAVDGTWEPGSVNYLQAGVEYGLKRLLFLRLGWQQPLSDNLLGGLADLTAGVGVSLGGLRFDYAYLPYGDLGVSHRISVGYAFGTGRPGESAAPSTGAIVSPRPRTASSGPGNEAIPEKREVPTGAAGPAGPPGARAALPETEKGRPGAPASAPGPDHPVPLSGPVSGSLGARSEGEEKPSASSPGPLPAETAAGGVKGSLPGPVPSQTPGDSLVVQFELPDDASPTPTPTGARLEKNKEYRKAAQAYEDALRKDPKDAASWWALGDLYLRFNRKADAVRCFEQVLKLQPENRKLADWLEKYKESTP